MNILSEVHKRTGQGGGGGGGCWGGLTLSDFLCAAREIWAKSGVKEVSKSFYYFEEIDIFHFKSR